MIRVAASHFAFLGFLGWRARQEPVLRDKPFTDNELAAQADAGAAAFLAVYRHSS